MTRFTLSLLTVLLIPAWLPAARAADDLVPMSAAQIAGHGIQTAAPTPVSYFSTNKLPAEVAVPNAQQRVISAPQPGLLEVMLVAVGDHVQKGQTVAHLRSPDLIAHQSDLLQTQSRLHLAKSNFERDEQLYKEGIIAERRYLESRSLYQELEALMAQRRQTLHLAGMSDTDIRRLEKDKVLTGSLDIRAPIDGVIMEQTAVAGQRLEAASPLYRIAHLDPLWLEIHAPLKLTGDVQLGDKVTVAGGNARGRIITIGSEMHPADQGILLRAEVDQGVEALRPGQFVQVTIECRCRSEDTYSLPRSAIVRMGSRSMVFVRVARGFAARDVTVRQDTEAATIVSGDLAPDSAVAINGTATLKAALSGIGGGE